MCYFCRVKIHEIYLSRCLELGEKALGRSAPNPMVGAVLVAEGRIIGEGYTSAYGGPHAEVNAIRSVREKELLASATLYVSLEPCNHHGKTPPCTDLILQSAIPRVVVGVQDPHALVNGSGIDRLRNAGVEVITGVMTAGCRHHHRRFLTFHEQQRPYIILKWARSADGFMAPPAGNRGVEAAPYWITGARSRQLVHKWRTEEQAILVGSGTAREDNPRLTSRSWWGPNPLRLVTDKALALPKDLHLLDGNTPTWVFYHAGLQPEPLPGVRHLQVSPEEAWPEAICKGLHAEGITSLLVEGGAQTLEGFIRMGLWDEARVFTGPEPLGGGLPSPCLTGHRASERMVGRDQLQIWFRD